MAASEQRKQRRAHLHAITDPNPSKESDTTEGNDLHYRDVSSNKRQRQPFHFPTVTFGGVLHREPKKERDLIDYATTASWWRGFAIGSLTNLLIGLFIGVAVTHATQILSIPITKETMEQGAMISKLFTGVPN